MAVFLVSVKFVEWSADGVSTLTDVTAFTQSIDITSVTCGIQPAIAESFHIAATCVPIPTTLAYKSVLRLSTVC